jgi:hypothetical protein
MISGDHGGKGVNRPRPVAGEADSLANPGSYVPDVVGSQLDDIRRELGALANRLRRTRVACGDFMRVLGRPAQTVGEHVTGVFLDPPYDPGERRTDLYGVGDRAGVTKGDDDHPSVRARNWALEHGPNPKFRIAYCGYSGPEDDMFRDAGWTVLRWTTAGGYALAGEAENRSRSNMGRETIWFSPHCLDPHQQPLSLFDGLDEPVRPNRPATR